MAETREVKWLTNELQFNELTPRVRLDRCSDNTTGCLSSIPPPFVRADDMYFRYADNSTWANHLARYTVVLRGVG